MTRPGFTFDELAAVALLTLKRAEKLRRLSQVNLDAVEGVALQAMYNIAQRGLRGGAPRPKAGGAGAARSEDTSTEFPVAKKT